MFKQAFFHPVVNAVKFGKQGCEISVFINLVQKPGTEEFYMEFKLCNTGCGIAQEDIKNLFSTFKIEDEEENTSFSKGVGLGLSTTFLLAEAMGGSVKIDS